MPERLVTQFFNILDGREKESALQTIEASRWNEPGLWRPTWVIDREFYGNEGEVLRIDRAFLKLTANGGVRLISANYKKPKRPLLAIGKPKDIQAVNEPISTKGLSAKEKLSLLQQLKYKNRKEEGEEGTYNWQNEMAKPGEGELLVESKIPDPYCKFLRLVYQGTILNGKYDPYAMVIPRGLMYLKGRFKPTDKKSTVKPIGSFHMRANFQRPVVTKDFQAFQC